MNLDEELLQEMSTAQSWNRGVNYYRNDRVEEAKLEGNTLKAKVSGSSYPFYEVKIETEPPILAHCSCPYDFGGICKHIIAVGLTWINEGESLPRAEDEKEELQAELKELTEGLGRDDILQILTELVYQDGRAMNTMLDYVEKSGEAPAKAVLKKLDLLRGEALEVIEEFNSYGGGPGYEEDLFYENIFEMIAILESHEIPAGYRRELIENFLPEYIRGNCGLVEEAFELVYAAAESEEDWLTVIDYLEKTNSKYDREKVMEIYRDKLGKEEKYLELRREHLETGFDYYDLACFYRNRGEIKRAVEVALEGQEKGSGRIIDNIKFLREFYQEAGDYERALQFYLKEFKKDFSCEKYFAILGFCREEDKVEIEKELMEVIEGGSYWKNEILASIYEEKEKYEKILELVLQDNLDPGRYEEILVSEFSGEMVDYYKKQVQKFIDNKKRKSYRRGAQTALKIREIYREILGESEKWQEYYQGILESYPRRSALQDEFKKACDPEYQGDW